MPKSLTSHALQHSGPVYVFVHRCYMCRPMHKGLHTLSTAVLSFTLYNPLEHPFRQYATIQNSTGRPAELLCTVQLGMYDSGQALKRLQGKYVVMFGDSTLEENMYDIILLLSDMSRNRTMMDSFVMAGVW